MKIKFKSGERFFVNGAVLKFASRVEVELMNNVDFLLEAHIIQPENTNTPLKQLYFVVQTVMMDKTTIGDLQDYMRQLLSAQLVVFDNEEIRRGLMDVAELLKLGRNFAALKILRTLFPIEQGILDQDDIGDPVIAMQAGALGHNEIFAA